MGQYVQLCVSCCCVRTPVTQRPKMSAKTNSLSGKVVLVTGASSGIGAGTAVHLASLGCKIALVARNKVKLEEVAAQCREAGSQEVLVCPHDLAMEQECISAVEETVKHFQGKTNF